MSIIPQKDIRKETRKKQGREGRREGRRKEKKDRKDGSIALIGSSFLVRWYVIA